MKSKKKSKKSVESTDMDRMRRKFTELRDKKDRKGSGNGDSAYLRLETGKNLVRVLPWPKGDGVFYTEGPVHFRVGPNEKTIRCPDPDNFDQKRGVPREGTKCYLCRRFLREQSRINSEYKKGDEDGRAEWGRAKQKYAPRLQHYMNVVTEDGDVKIASVGPQIMEQLLGYFFSEDSDVAGDFTDLENGRWINIKRVGGAPGKRDRRTSYEVRPMDEVDDLSDQWDEIKAILHDLESEDVMGKLLSAKEIEAVYKGEEEDGDESEADEDEKEEDGEEEEEDEDEEADEAEEEDARPKKSKLAAKLKARAKAKG